MKLPQRRFFNRLSCGVLLIMMAVFFIANITSCNFSFKSDTKSFTDYLVAIDAFIEQGRFDDAVAVLDKHGKEAFSASARLAVYKRYIKLGDEEKAEKALVRGLKVLKGNHDLSAVYTNFLLHRGRNKEALSVSEALQDTRYSSLYAEAVLRNTDKDDLFFNSKYKSTYVYSYERTKENFWLRDVAVLQMLESTAEESAGLTPVQFENRQDAIFWATLQYDAHDYGKCLKILDETKELEAYEPKSIMVDTLIAMMKADATLLFGNEKEAYNIRADYLSEYEDSINSESPVYSTLPVFMVNNVYWKEKQGDYIERYKLLDKIIKQWPRFVPGLIAYGNYAVETSMMKETDPLTIAVRKAGLKSINMVKFDSIPKVPVEDAIYLMKDTDLPSLIALRRKLEDIVNVDKSIQEKIVKVYDALEGTELETNYYPSELMEYAVGRLISLGKIDDARKLFYNYMKAKYGEMDFEKNPENVDYWECEYIAYFAALDRRYLASKNLYEYNVYSSHRKSVQFVSSAINGDTSITAMVNLAMIYNSTGYGKDALKLYSDASSLTDDNYDKAEILYRMACIHNDNKETENAISVLQYCLNLNPGHEKARQLYRSLAK